MDPPSSLLGFHVLEARSKAAHPHCPIVLPCICPQQFPLCTQAQDPMQQLKWELARAHQAREVQQSIADRLVAQIGINSTLARKQGSSLFVSFCFESLAEKTSKMHQIQRSAVLPCDVHSKVKKNVDNKEYQLEKCSPDGKVILRDVENDGTTSECFLSELQLSTPVVVDVDPVLPCGALLPDQCSSSVEKRVRVLLHDHQQKKHGASVEEVQRKARFIALSISALAEGLHSAVALEVASVFPKDPVVQFSECDAKTVELSCWGFRHQLLRPHYEKLKTIYKAAEKDFHLRVFTLLQRYFILAGCGEDSAAESGWHGAVPPSCFQLLHTDLQVDFECFASPFNCCTTQYCSAFPDTDGCFGSLGSFFEFFPTEGMYEVNPPFDHTVAVRAAQHMVRCLEESQFKEKSLGFILFLPYADKGKPLKSVGEVCNVLMHPQFLAHVGDIAGGDAAYVDGYQQCQPDTFFTSRLDTRIFVLLNPAAAEKYVVSDVIEKLIATWTHFSPQCAVNASIKSKQKR